MTRIKQRPIINQPHTLTTAAKVLDTDEEFLINWILGGEIRACVFFANFHRHKTETAAYVNGDIDLKAIHEEFLEEDSPSTNTDEDIYHQYSSERNLDKCPLNKLFSTAHSNLHINSFTIYDNDKNSAQLDAYLHGLWQIETLDDIKEILNHPNKENILINIVPYVAESLYNSQENGKQGGYIYGFHIEMGINDIRISYDDMVRLRGFLDEGKKLGKLDGDKTENNTLLNIKQLSPTTQTNVVITQLIQTNPFYGPAYIDRPYSAADLINKYRKSKEKESLKLAVITVGHAITEAKKILFDRIPLDELKTKTNNLPDKQPRMPNKLNCATLVQLIHCHPFFDYKILENPDRAHELMGNTLVSMSKEQLKIDPSLLSEVIKVGKDELNKR